MISFPLERSPLLGSVISWVLVTFWGDLVLIAFVWSMSFKKHSIFPQFWDKSCLFMLEYPCDLLKNILGY